MEYGLEASGCVSTSRSGKGFGLFLIVCGTVSRQSNASVWLVCYANGGAEKDPQGTSGRRPESYDST